MSNNKLQLLFVLLTLAIANIGYTNEIRFPKRPKIGQYIVDEAKALKSDKTKEFNSRLSAHFHHTTAQLILVIITSKEHYGANELTMAEYAKRMREKWFHNDWATRGILTVISMDDGTVSAFVPEYAIPNRRTKQKALLEETISTQLKENKDNIAQGIDAALQACMALYPPPKKTKVGVAYFLKIAFFLGFIIWMVNIIFYKRSVSKFWYYVGYPIWLIVGLFTAVTIHSEMVKIEKADREFNPFR